jgi:DNA polymerase III subunit delta
MPTINYKELEKYIKENKEDQFASVFLIYGEELLCKEAFEKLLDALVPGSGRSLNYDPFDGSSEDIHEVIARVNTFSLLSGKKVVSIIDSRIFYSKQNEENILEKAKEEYDKNDIKKAAKHLLSLLGLLNLSFEDVDKTNRSKTFKNITSRFSDEKWIDEIIDYCLDNSLSVPSGEDKSKKLQEAIEKGFPKGNHLIITTDFVDKRKSLYKSIGKNGIIIDCFVPKGDRRADKVAQEAVLNEKMKFILTQNDKTMDRNAYMAMYKMTGFDLRTFSSNMDKLISYVGERKSITAQDVEYVLKRTKKDPIYEFTNAVTDKNIEGALFYLDSLLTGGEIDHPLQLLAAIVNQIRKLLIIKDFTESSRGSVWFAGCRYDHFRSKVMPEIIEHDRAFLKQVDDWENMLSEEMDEDVKKQKKGIKKKKKSKASTDLIIAKNPKNTYPVFMMLQKSDKFTKNELIYALECLNKADLGLKKTRQNPKLVLENALIKICMTGT